MRPKTNRFATWLLGSLCALFLANCTGQQEEPVPELVAVRYAQTQCADRWGQAQGTQQLEAAARAYLAQQGLVLQQLRARVINPGAFCNACTCPTGLLLEGAARPADLPAVLALGFTKD